jgi:tetratricopeptide (TPR) repeat protein
MRKTIFFFFAIIFNGLYAQPPGSWYTSSSSPKKQLEEISGGTFSTFPVSSPTPVGESYAGPSQLEITMYYNQQFSGELQKQAYNAYKIGNKAYKKGKYKKAKRKYNRAKRSDPSVWEYKDNYNKAETMIDRKKAEKEKRKAYLKKYGENLKKNERINREFLDAYNKNILVHQKEVKHARKVVKAEVPDPTVVKKKVVYEGIMLGLFNYGSNHDGFKVKSPKTGNYFNEANVFCTSDRNPFKYGELIRGVLDNMSIGEFTKMTPYGKELIRRLEGTHFNTLYAHSNGATFSEALILEGIITVDELHIMGGDRSMMNDEGYQRLIASGRVKKVVVWINPGDPVPILSSVPNMVKGQFKEAHQSIMSMVGKAQEKKYPPSSDVVYHYLEGKEYKGQSLLEPLVSHGLTTMFDNIHVHKEKFKDQ